MYKQPFRGCLSRKTPPMRLQFFSEKLSKKFPLNHLRLLLFLILHYLRPSREFSVKFYEPSNKQKKKHNSCLFHSNLCYLKSQTKLGFHNLKMIPLDKVDCNILQKTLNILLLTGIKTKYFESYLKKKRSLVLQNKAIPGKLQ